MSLLLYITHHLLNFLHKSSFPRIVAACITLCCTFHRRPQRTCLVILSPARTASYMGTSHSFSVWAHFGGWSWRQWVQVADEHVSCEGDSGGSLQDALSAAETERRILICLFCAKGTVPERQRGKDAFQNTMNVFAYVVYQLQQAFSVMWRIKEDGGRRKNTVP